MSGREVVDPAEAFEAGWLIERRRALVERVHIEADAMYGPGLT
jgi:hypothetical protein